MLGCGAMFAGIVAVVVAATGRAFPLVVLLALVVIALLGAERRWQQRRLLRKFRATFSDAGKDLLLVYTSSPNWEPYIATNWLPKWEARAVVLNRSKPWSRAQLEAVIWKSFAGFTEHTPVAIVLPARGPARVFKFWRAFRDFKHGKDQKLRATEAELQAALDEIAAPEA